MEGNDLAADLDAFLARHSDELVEFRRDLHANPELANAEHRTTRRVALRLAAAGLRPVMLPKGTGLLVDIGSEQDGNISSTWLIDRNLSVFYVHDSSLCGKLISIRCDRFGSTIFEIDHIDSAIPLSSNHAKKGILMAHCLQHRRFKRINVASIRFRNNIRSLIADRFQQRR